MLNSKINNFRTILCDLVQKDYYFHPFYMSLFAPNQQEILEGSDNNSNPSLSLQTKRKKRTKVEFKIIYKIEFKYSKIAHLKTRNGLYIKQ